MHSTKFERMLGKCWKLNQRFAEAFQTVPTLCQQRNQHLEKFDSEEPGEELRTGNQTLPSRFCGLVSIRWACVCSTIVERSVQRASTPFNIFENKGKVESILNEILNRFKFDSTRFQQAFNNFYAFNNVGRPVQTRPTFGSTMCWTHVEAYVEAV